MKYPTPFWVTEVGGRIYRFNTDHIDEIEASFHRFRATQTPEAIAETRAKVREVLACDSA